MNVICYGDSNTYGYDPRSYLGGRYDPCWVDLLARRSGWNITNSGMNGRRIPRRPLDLPKETDLLIILLGDNDLLSGLSAGETAQRMKAFLKKLSLPRDRVFLVAPPPMQRGEWVPSRELITASGELAAAYQALANRLGIGFANAGDWNIPMAYDGVHFTEAGHRRFAEGLYDALLRRQLRRDAAQIITSSIHAVLPDEAVGRALREFCPGSGRTVLVAAGKAAWQMARAAVDTLGAVDSGIVITKYGHVKGELPGITCYEGGHPVPDGHGFAATKKALELVSGLTAQDTVLFLLSGGGSALFESPLIPGAELQEITGQLLACGADIVEMNTVRKRLSAVKGGRFALACAPARVFSIVLSDVLGDPLDVIASGPACPDPTSCADARAVVQKYNLRLSPQALACLDRETPKELPNVTTHITGSVRELVAAAAAECEKLGYAPTILTHSLRGEAREAGVMLARQLVEQAGDKIALIAGGETVVHLTGTGLGGRNQELALAAAPVIAGLPGACLFSLGSDGTDGPTDAAGGYVDSATAGSLEALGISIPEVLANNDAYHALLAVDGLIRTGPTGTNVNDVSVALLVR